jgi:hypothetical protein
MIFNDLRIMKMMNDVIRVDKADSFEVIMSGGKPAVPFQDEAAHPLYIDSGFNSIYVNYPALDIWHDKYSVSFRFLPGILNTLKINGYKRFFAESKVFLR